MWKFVSSRPRVQMVPVGAGLESWLSNSILKPVKIPLKERKIIEVSFAEK